MASAATRRRGLALVLTLLGACGDDGDDLAHGDMAAPDGDAAVTDGADGDASDDALPAADPSEPPPLYRDPDFTEPAAPSASEVDAALATITAEADAALDDAAKTALEDAAATHGGPAAGAGAALDLRLDAARWLFTRAPSTPSALASLAALELLAGDASPAALDRAALLSRAALGALGGVGETTPLATRRTAAAAWNNLGRARLGLGDAAGALHAFRQASALFVSDASYATGVAAALAAADLVVPAYQQARRAASLEALADPALAASRHTPARAWMTHLEAELARGFAFAPDATLVPRGGGAVRFPDVGSTLLGMEVVAALDDGVAVSAPAFEAHGPGHLAGSPGTCTIEESELIPGARKAVFTCPETPAPIAFKPWVFVPERTVLIAPRVIEDGLTCDNAVTRAFEPEPRTMRVRPFGLPNRAASHAAGLGLALQSELAAIEASLGVPDHDIEGLELCADYGTGADAWQAAEDVLAARCDTCLCGGANPDCLPCWQRYAETCADLFARATGIAAREERRAFADDIPHQRNMERYFAMMPVLTAMARGLDTCDAGCASTVAEEFHWGWVDAIGGRYPAFLRGLRDTPPIAFLACMAQVADGCAPAVAGTPKGAPGEVPCICLGAGPIGYCIQADGTVEVTVDAGVSLGFKANIPEGASSIRVGIGAGVSANLGPATAGVSYMAWFDPTRGRFAGHDLAADVSLGLPGGGSVGSSFVCDAWQDDAPERAADPDSLVLEATVADPP